VKFEGCVKNTLPAKCHYIHIEINYFDKFTNIESLLCLTNVVKTFTELLASRKAAQPSAPFQFAASRRVHSVVQCIAINIRFLLTAFEESFCVLMKRFRYSRNAFFFLGWGWGDGEE